MNKFKKLTFIEKTEKRTKYGAVISKFRCDCGNISEHEEARVKKGIIGSCGCLRKTKNPDKSGTKALLTMYKYNAGKRNIGFYLSLKDFELLIKQPCHYCGSMPKKMNKKGFGVLANGVDRKNSDLDYSLENCVSACSTCNYAKNDLSYEEFLVWISRLVDFRGGLI